MLQGDITGNDNIQATESSIDQKITTTVSGTNNIVAANGSTMFVLKIGGTGQIEDIVQLIADAVYERIKGEALNNQLTEDKQQKPPASSKKIIGGRKPG